MDRRIPHDEVKFHPHSFADPDGRLFWWRDRLYRGLRSEWATLFRKLLQRGIIQRLIERGLLVETEPTELTLDGYAIVVRHRPLPFASYPEEWCPAMLRDAALAMVELLMELACFDLTLKDSHPWNLLFDGCRPVYVDLTSIVSLKEAGTWPGHDEFRRFYLHPLILMAHEQDRIARRLLPEYGGVSKSDLLRLTQSVFLPEPLSSIMDRLRSLTREDLPQACKKLLKLGSRPSASGLNSEVERRTSLLVLLKKTEQEIKGIPLHSLSAAVSDSDHHSTPSLPPDESWTAKQRALHEILRELRPNSVLDMESNTGWYSKLAALLGSHVVAFDNDLERVTQLYHHARDERLPILPLMMDFVDPTPARGLSSHWAIAATERFQCDMVMALGLVHKIVFKRSLNFEQIVEGLASYSKRWLLVEFVPSGDEELCNSGSQLHSWYTIENLVATLRRWFRRIDIRPSHPSPRVLLLCEK
jgi:hypothetical protein